MIKEFDVPVCNSFKAKIQNDQLCYEVDLNKFSNKVNKVKELKLGFNFVLDYNEDRQITFVQKSERKKQVGLASSLVESYQDLNAFIYLDTIGGYKTYLSNSLIKSPDHDKKYFVEPFMLVGEGEYNVNVLTQIQATDSYVGLDQNIKECQDEETLYNCTTRHYMDTILENCGCLPINLRIWNNAVCTYIL